MFSFIYNCCNIRIIKIICRPLIGVIIFQPTTTADKGDSFSFRPLIGVIIFQHLKKAYEKGAEIVFPSPYRGYHLSTLVFCLIFRDKFIKFPSPYRGYHLSTISTYTRMLLGDSSRFRPLIGVIIFQHGAHDVIQLNPMSFRPLIGVIIFQRFFIFRINCLFYCFRPLIGVIIFQQL